VHEDVTTIVTLIFNRKFATLLIDYDTWRFTPHRTGSQGIPGKKNYNGNYR
jgi:hypothetical protein